MDSVLPRKALIGEQVQLPDGRIGKVTGVNVDTGYARVVIVGTTFVDVPQDDLKYQLIPRVVRGR